LRHWDAGAAQGHKAIVLVIGRGGWRALMMDWKEKEKKKKKKIE
jgi:hypothetical protein